MTVPIMTSICCIGLETFAGEYLCWMPEGFLMGIDGLDIPPVVSFRKPSFHDYPGDDDPLERKRVHVIGVLNQDKSYIHAVKWWADDQEQNS